MRILRLPGVYGPCRDSELLARAIAEEVEAGDGVLDVFTGSGVQAVTAAHAGARAVTAIDIGRRAALSARLNGMLNGARVEVLRGSGFEPVKGRRFDLVVANPPYVPSVQEGEPSGPARAWEGGHDGRVLLDLFIAGVGEHLTDRGRVLIVHSSLCGTERTLAMLEEAGLGADVIDSETAPLGPITAPRAAELERRGILRPGERTERTVVIRGAVGVPAEGEPRESRVAQLVTA